MARTKKEPQYQETTKLLRRNKVVPIQELDPSTGEVIPAQKVTCETKEGDFNYKKIWFFNFLLGVESITNKKMELAFFILGQANRKNQIMMTQEEISKKSGVSIATVKRTMKALLEGPVPILIKKSNSIYLINPDVMWQGSFTNRMVVRYEFNETKEYNDQNKKKAVQANVRPDSSIGSTTDKKDNE